jgi:hypothetical protein
MSLASLKLYYCSPVPSMHFGSCSPASGKATRGETEGEIIFCCPAHLKYLFADGRAFLFCFSRAQIFVSAIFRERFKY